MKEPNVAPTGLVLCCTLPTAYAVGSIIAPSGLVLWFASEREVRGHAAILGACRYVAP